MRLINEDTVMEIIERVTNEAVEKKQPKYLIQPRIIAEIAGLPIIEAEPVKHGRWIRGENKGFPEKPSMIWYCSVCGERIRYNDTPRTYQKIKKKVNEVNPRCRRCGARMDGDSE